MIMNHSRETNTPVAFLPLRETRRGALPRWGWFPRVLLVIACAPAIALAQDSPAPRGDAAQESVGATAEVSAEQQAAFDAIQNTTPADREALKSDQPRQLSVQPGKQPLLPPDRPAWVAAPPDLTTSVHRLFVGGELVTDPQAADRGLDGPLVESLRQYIDQHIAEQPGMAKRVAITPEFIRTNLLQPDVQYVAELSTSAGPMYQKWVVLEITPEHREVLRQMLVAAIQRERFGPIGLGAFGVLTSIALIHWLARRRARRQAQAEPSAGAGSPPRSRSRLSVASASALVAGLVAVPAAMGITGLALLVGYAHVQEVPAPRSIEVIEEHEVATASAVDAKTAGASPRNKQQESTVSITIRKGKSADE
ncbi:MAG: hypothetical protein D6753_00525 [Planctomycetota bacterium]|nr:MAG: hypothetical protein D6753_00525 [Planctomycetota bacterium]